MRCVKERNREKGGGRVKARILRGDLQIVGQKVRKLGLSARNERYQIGAAYLPLRMSGVRSSKEAKTHKAGKKRSKASKGNGVVSCSLGRFRAIL